MQITSGLAPKAPFRIEQNSMFNRDLLACYPLQSQPHTNFELVTNRIVPANGLGGGTNINIIPEINARAIDLTVTNAESPKDANFVLPDAGGITIMWWQFVAASTTTVYAFNIGAIGTTDRVLCHPPYSDDTLYWDYGSSSTGRVSTDYSSFFGAVHQIVLWAEGDSGNGEGQGIQIDGKVLASNANTATPTTLTNLAVGNRLNQNDTSRHPGYMAFFMIWHGAKPAAFRQALWNPETRWDMFQQLDRSVYLAVAAVAADGTLLLLKHIKNFNRDFSGGMR